MIIKNQEHDEQALTLRKWFHAPTIQKVKKNGVNDSTEMEQRWHQTCGKDNEQLHAYITKKKVQYLYCCYDGQLASKPKTSTSSGNGEKKGRKG